VSESLKESKLLESANSAGMFTKLSAYAKVSGPGIWLTLAALSAGSLIGSLGLGQRLGTEGLWVQAWAMLLGMFSLWAVSHIALNTQQSLFSLLKNEWNPSLGWWLACSAMITNFAWCMPQFRFGADVTGSILLPFLDNKMGKIAVALSMLCLAIFLSIWYEKSGFRSKLIQWLLRIMLWSLVGLILVSVVLVLPKSKISAGDIALGLLPQTSHFSEVPSSFHSILDQAGEFKSFWEEKLLSKQRELTLITFSSTLGVNLLFALPLILLGRGWKREHSGFAKFNFFWGLFIPFVLCSSCLTLLSTIAHQKVIDDVLSTHQASVISKDDLSHGPIHDLLAKRVCEEMGEETFHALPPFQQETQIESLDPAEHLLARSVISTGLFDWIKILEKIDSSAKYLIGFAVLIIVFSTILILMILNGHLVCEVLNKPHKGAPFQSGSLVLALASVGPFVWADQDTWVADPTYFLSLAILPYALLSFILMLNSKELLGRKCPTGISGSMLNLGATLSFLFLGSSSFYLAWNERWGEAPVGQIFVILIGILILVGYFTLKNQKLSNRISGLETRFDQINSSKSS